MNKIRFICSALVVVLLSSGYSAAQIERERGTLVVAVPVNAGLVACADKRLFNADAGTFTDEFIKIRKAGPTALFAATHTVGFYDRKSKKMAFDVFKLTQDHVDKTPFSNTKTFWDGLKQEILQQMLIYLSGQPYAVWPDTDEANRGLLFNLIFYSTANGKPFSHTVRVLYEKKSTPVVTVLPVMTEEVRSPKLSGKGRDVLRFLGTSPALANDPAILKFDSRSFMASTTNTSDAIAFARKLFQLTNTAVPQAQVSSTFDCALLDNSTGFRVLSP